MAGEEGKGEEGMKITTPWLYKYDYLWRTHSRSLMVCVTPVLRRWHTEGAKRVRFIVRDRPTKESVRMRIHISRFGHGKIGHGVLHPGVTNWLFDNTDLSSGCPVIIFVECEIVVA